MAKRHGWALNKSTYMVQRRGWALNKSTYMVQRRGWALNKIDIQRLDALEMWLWRNILHIK